MFRNLKLLLLVLEMLKKFKFIVENVTLQGLVHEYPDWKIGGITEPK